MKIVQLTIKFGRISDEIITIAEELPDGEFYLLEFDKLCGCRNNASSIEIVRCSEIKDTEDLKSVISEIIKRAHAQGYRDGEHSDYSGLMLFPE